MIKRTIIFLLLFITLSSSVFAQHVDEHEEECPGGLCPREANPVVDLVIKEKINNAAVISMIIWFVASLAIFMRGMRAKKKKKSLKILFNICFVAVIILIGFSYYYYNLSASETTGITVCEAGECFWAAHIHSELDLQVCGEEKKLDLETGPLEAVHTHKERNKLHFHERLSVDSETMKVSDYSLLTLRSFFENVEVEFSNECFFDKCKDDLCDGRISSVSMTVNDVENFEFEEYIWSDGDQIIIKFE